MDDLDLVLSNFKGSKELQWSDSLGHAGENVVVEGQVLEAAAVSKGVPVVKVVVVSLFKFFDKCHFHFSILPFLPVYICQPVVV